MKTIKLIIILFFTIELNAQIAVGIGTTNPQALFEIKVPALLGNFAGILIPRVSAFPVINPTNAQDSMLVFLTQAAGTNTRGFYYWDKLSSSWVKLVDSETFEINDLLDGKSDTSTSALPYSSVYLGKNSGATDSSEDRKNVAVGFETMNQNDSNYSVALGYQALKAGNANNSVAVGYMAMANTSGVVDCIAIGKEAMLNAINHTNSTLINDNIAIGLQALKTTEGNTNIGIGNKALLNNTTGSYNTAIGFETLKANTTGSYNIAIGYQTLFKNAFKVVGGTQIPADNNIAIGYQALYNNVGGSDNTAFGNNALYNNVSGYNNTAIGNNSLLNLSSGFNNFAIGLNAGDNLTTGNNNFIIGNNIDFPSTTNSNQLNIGNLIYGVNIDGNDNTISSGNIGIAVKNPLEKLDINGALKIGNTITQNAGTIRWTGTDFEGYNGTNWVSLTKGNYWTLTGNNITNPNTEFLGTINSADLVFKTNNTERMRLTTQGDLKLITNPTNSIFLRNGSNYAHGFDPNINFSANPDNSWMLASRENLNASSGILGNSTFVAIWSTGNVDGKMVRFLNQNNWTDNNGNPYDNTAEKSYIDANGQYFQGSDKYRKNNIRIIKNALDKISKLNGYTYVFKNDKSNKKTSGVIAQELYKVFPEAVQKNENNEYFVHYAGIIPLLIQGIKEQQNQIKPLEEKLKRLKNLEKRIKKLESQLKNKNDEN